MKRSTLRRLGLLSSLSFYFAASFAQHTPPISLTEGMATHQSEQAVSASEPTQEEKTATLLRKLQSGNLFQNGTGKLPPATKSSGWGVGLRFGDPTGITVKKYLAHKTAFEF